MNSTRLWDDIATREFLSIVYQETDPQYASDVIFNYIDRWLVENQFSTVDRILETIDVSQLTTGKMRSMLIITHAAKNLLPSYSAFYQTVENEMIKIRGKEMTERLIGRMK